MSAGGQRGRACQTLSLEHVNKAHKKLRLTDSEVHDPQLLIHSAPQIPSLFPATCEIGRSLGDWKVRGVGWWGAVGGQQLGSHFILFLFVFFFPSIPQVMLGLVLHNKKLNFLCRQPPNQYSYPCVTLSDTSPLSFLTQYRGQAGENWNSLYPQRSAWEG